MRVNVKKWPQECKVHYFVLANKIFAVIPFDDLVFNITDAVCIAVNFQDTVLDISQLIIIRVCKYGVLGRFCQYWKEPLD